MRPVVALCGKRYAGKDTLAAALEAAAAEIDRPFLRLAFADEAKRAFAQYYNARLAAAAASAGPHDVTQRVDGERLITDRAYKEQWRPQLTEFVSRALSEDPAVFVTQLVRAVECADPSALIVVTDLRLRSDLALLARHCRVHVVRVERSAQLREASGWRYAKAVDEHPTETEMDDPRTCNDVIRNEGPVAELRTHARALLARLEAGAPIPAAE